MYASRLRLDVLNVNPDGTFWRVRVFGRTMLARGRRSIINIGAMSGVIVTVYGGSSCW